MKIKTFDIIINNFKYNEYIYIGQYKFKFIYNEEIYKINVDPQPEIMLPYKKYHIVSTLDENSLLIKTDDYNMYSYKFNNKIERNQFKKYISTNKFIYNFNE